MKMIYKPLKLIAYHFYWKLISFSWYFLSKPTSQLERQSSFSIGITTYINRFESYFKPLIKQLHYCFPDTQLVVLLNGHYELEEQHLYIKKAKAFLDQYPNVKLVTFERPQSLSKLWNLCVINADAEKVLMLNDDLKLSPWFAKAFHASKILGSEIALINRSWSHYLISKSVLRRVGWFDERFPAIGNEDEDYEARLSMAKLPLTDFKIREIFNVVELPKKYSYGKDVDLVNVKYAKSNQDFFNLKWDKVYEKKKGYFYVPILNAYLKLKDGMETPNFYHHL